MQRYQDFSFYIYKKKEISKMQIQSNSYNQCLIQEEERQSQGKGVNKVSVHSTTDDFTLTGEA